jgi:hypothetical protein
VKNDGGIVAAKKIDDEADSVDDKLNSLAVCEN